MVGLSRLPRRSWRIHRLAICVLGTLAAFAACTSDRTPELLGAWQATILIEEGDTIDVILDDVGLFFSADGSYIYTSTLDYEESGSFRSKGDMLFTTPMNQDTLLERPVAIAMLTERKLHLNMKEGEKNRILEFERIDEVDLEPEGLDSLHDHSHDHDHGTEEVYDTTGFVDDIIDQ